jgi:cation-transporting ATPase F
VTDTTLRGARDHHSLAAHEVVLLLESEPVDGLSSADAEDRLRRYGHNVLPAAKPDGPLIRVLRQLNSPLVLILLAAGVVTAVLGEPVDSSVIFGVVVLNTVVGYLQETKAQAALDALRGMVRTEARVVRNARAHRVPSEDLVPGDLVLVEAGDKVPADVRLTRLAELRVDESALTGESQPVVKDEVALPVETPVADRRNMLYAGTLVSSGSGTGVVVATGADTELGQIHRLVGAAAPLATPLTRKIARFSRILTAVILALAAVTFAVGVVRGEPAVDMFTAAIALAVGAIPEGLPAAVTITLAIGVARMARRRAVVRRLPAVETLGSTTVIGTDKTGTLTENQMTVRRLWTPSGSFEVIGSGYAPEGRISDPQGRPADVAGDQSLRWCLLAGALCNDAALGTKEGRPSIVGDPTEAALLVVAGKAGLDTDVLAALPRVDTVPFDSERKYMATLHADPGARRRIVLAKGAVERVLPLCRAQMSAGGTTRPLDPDTALHAADGLAADGLRVLATAVQFVGEDADLDESALAGALLFCGLQALLDPPRPAAADAVAACHTAGIAVKMITGDHAKTATAIAGAIGLLPERRPGDVLTGADLGELPDADYPDAVDRAVVFARVSPEQKLRLVEALQARGRVVAMTGDGVNDAPALRQADIGIAMGAGGTEVAKDAADMVLTDDDFGTIEAAVEEGRGVFDNLSKFIVWTLPTNMGEGLVILVAIALGTSLPILPTQILWINMTTAVLLGLTLAFERKEPGIMSRPPRDPDRPLLTGALVVRILLLSVLMVAATWWLFDWERSHGADLAEARTAAVNLFVAIELLYLFSCRTLHAPVRRIGLFSNRWVLAGVALQVMAQAALTYLPPLNTAFQTAPLDRQTWLLIAVLSVSAWAVVALDKRFRRRIV